MDSQPCKLHSVPRHIDHVSSHPHLDTHVHPVGCDTAAGMHQPEAGITGSQSCLSFLREAGRAHGKHLGPLQGRLGAVCSEHLATQTPAHQAPQQLWGQALANNTTLPQHPRTHLSCIACKQTSLANEPWLCLVLCSGDRWRCKWTSRHDKHLQHKVAAKGDVYSIF